MKIFINLYCFFSLFLFSSLTFAFSGGTGTKDDPYLIMDCQGLQSIHNFPSEHFQLINDIDCSGFDYGDGGGFMPIGSSAYPFIGILDGDGFTISNLYINRSTQNQVGLIGELDEAALIQNLNVTASYIVGKDNTGGIVGYGIGDDISVYNVSFEGEVIGNENVGGLVGTLYSGTVSNSNATAKVTTASFNAGGLIGNANYANIINNYATGEVKSSYSASRAIGGLVGYMYGNNTDVFDKNSSSSIVTGYQHIGGLIGYSALMNIKNSYSDSSVNGTESVGGLIGYINNGSVTDSYAQGEILGDHYIGGLIGYANGSSLISVTNNYAAALVKAVMYAGGLIGYKTGTVNVVSSYWDKDVSGQPFSAGGTPKTTAEMYQQATYVNWNFNTNWQIDENVNYPQLRGSLTEE